MSPLITLKREIDIPTLVKWTIGIGGVLVWLTIQWTRVGTLEARIAELEGGMDVQNGVIYMGKSQPYYKGVREAMEAQHKLMESEP